VKVAWRRHLGGVGDKYQQELAAGVAHDMAQVINLNRSTCVRYGCFDDLLLTDEGRQAHRGSGVLIRAR
jgi:hypothetical protein